MSFDDCERLFEGKGQSGLQRPTDSDGSKLILIAGGMLDRGAKVAAGPIDAIRPSSRVDRGREFRKLIIGGGGFDAARAERSEDPVEVLQVFFVGIRVRGGCSWVARQVAHH